MLVNVTSRGKTQRISVKFLKEEHDEIIRKANISGRLRLAFSYEASNTSIILRPDNSHNSNVLCPTAGKWAYIVSYDGAQKRIGRELVPGREIELPLVISDRLEISVDISELMRSSVSLDFRSIVKAIDLVNSAIDNGMRIVLKDGRLAAELAK